jgi:hypothetical protein
MKSVRQQTNLANVKYTPIESNLSIEMANVVADRLSRPKENHNVNATNKTTVHVWRD